MKVLHLTSQYTVSKVYKELLENIQDVANIDQIAFVGRRKETLINKYNLENDKIKFISKVTYSKLDRILYFTRLYKTKKSVEQESLTEVDIIHAHTLFADGGVAYLLNKKYGKDYIVTVRSTDIEGYLKKMPHTKILLKKILLNSQKIVFLSYGLCEQLMKSINKKTAEKIKDKIEIVPNGISEFWHKNINTPKSLDGNKEYSFIQVSELIKRKNVDKSMDIISRLNNLGIKSRLTIVGEGQYKSQYNKYMLANGYNDFVNFVGQVQKEELINLYRDSDFFIMPSEGETFGLVYIEALSQGLPIIYTTGTGVDKYFQPYEVGFPINPNDFTDVEDKLNKIIENYNEISSNAIRQTTRFNWKEIAKTYLSIYGEIKK